MTEGGSQASVEKVKEYVRLRCLVRESVRSQDQTWWSMPNSVALSERSLESNALVMAQEAALVTCDEVEFLTYCCLLTAACYALAQKLDDDSVAAPGPVRSLALTFGH